MTDSRGGAWRVFLGVYSIRIAAAAAAFAAAAIAARALGPERFGAFALLLMLTRIVAEVVGPAIDTAIVRFGANALAQSEEAARPYFAYLLKMKWALSAIGLIVAAVAAVPLQRTLFAKYDVPAWAIFIAIAGGAVMVQLGSGVAVLQAYKRFTRAAMFELANSVLRCIAYGAVILGAGWLVFPVEAEPGSLIVAHTAAIAVIAVIMVMASPRGIWGTTPSADVRGEVWGFTSWVVAACAATSIGQGADLFILAIANAPAAEIGHYRAAIQLAIIGELAMMTLFQFLLPKASECPPSELPSFLRRNQLRAAGLSAVALLGLPIAPIAVPLIFGEEYRASAPIFCVFFVGTVFVLSSAPAGAVIYAANRPKHIAGLEWAKLVGIVAFGVWAAYQYGAFGVAVAVTAVRGGIAVATFIIARRVIAKRAA